MVKAIMHLRLQNMASMNQVAEVKQNLSIQCYILVSGQRKRTTNNIDK